jgi:23S rRNA-/tRNA-specific pseudouridylate synthase
VPVHASGRYRRNALDYLLKIEFQIEFEVKLIHRLDRVTTGVLILAKNSKTVTKIGQSIESGKFKKYYLARVHGCMKENEIQLVDKHLYLQDARRAKWKFVENNEQLEELKKSLPSSSYLKSAKTVFLSLGYDKESDSSLIFCAPQTVISTRIHG